MASMKLLPLVFFFAVLQARKPLHPAGAGAIPDRIETGGLFGEGSKL
jgi:hypothetical protein